MLNPGMLDQQRLDLLTPGNSGPLPKGPPPELAPLEQHPYRLHMSPPDSHLQRTLQSLPHLGQDLNLRTLAQKVLYYL